MELGFCVGGEVSVKGETGTIKTSIALIVGDGWLFTGNLREDFVPLGELFSADPRICIRHPHLPDFHPASL